MNIDAAIQEACQQVSVAPPRVVQYGKWLRTDTLSGKNGKNDAQIIIDDRRVTAMNFQTGETATVWVQDASTPKDKRVVAEKIKAENEKKKAKAERSAKTAASIIASSVSSTHPYLSAKGFPSEKALVVDAAYLRQKVGDYLIAGDRAVVMPARIGDRVTSVQLIWEDGTKKFLAGGEITGSCYRIARGSDVWHCEGFATGLTLRAALKGLNRSDTILCCFSASNVSAVARQSKGRGYILTDNDKPLDQFEGLGTGEYWARTTERPYLLPPEIGEDLNDMHRRVGIFAVQKIIANFLREARS